MMVDVNSAWERGVHCARTGGEACEAVQAALKLASQRMRVGANMNRGSAGANQLSMEYYGTGTKTTDDSESSLDLLLLSDLPPSLIHCTWPTVAGFSFAAKSWGVVMVDGLKDATFNDKAFDQLVLPPERKRLIEALVLAHNDDDRGE